MNLYSGLDVRRYASYQRCRFLAHGVASRRLGLFCISLLVLHADRALALTGPPPQNYVLKFSGQQVAAAPVTAALELGTAFTMEAWVYLDRADSYAFLLGKPNDPRGVDPFMSYALTFSSDGSRLEFIQTTGAPGSYRSIQAPADFPKNIWTHVAASLSGSQMRLFVNGELVSTGGSPGPPPASAGPFCVGGATQRDGSVVGGFTGVLMQARVWSRVLDAVELQSRAGSLVSGQEPGLLAAWPLDDGSGLTSHDVGPSHLDLSLGYLGGTFAPAWVRKAVVDAGPFFRSTRYPLPVASLPAGDFFDDIFPIDFDSDGSVDFVVTALHIPPTFPATSAPLTAMRNDGEGRFSDATAFVLGSVQLVWPRHFAVADFDGDGRKDILIADHGTDIAPFPGGQSRLFIHTPDGRLSDETTSRLPAVQAFTHNIAVGDVNADGYPDIYMCNIGGSENIGPTIYQNDGKGYFTAAAAGLPAELTDLKKKYTASALADFNGDGSLDLVLGGEPGDGPARDALLLNDGKGLFTFAPDTALPLRLGGPGWGTVHAVAVDVDNDGWPDLLLSVTSGDYNAAAIQLLLNNRDGTFRDATANVPQAPEWTAGSATSRWIKWIAVADFNGDGWPDFAVAGYGVPPRLFLNEGGGRFVDQTGICPFDGSTLVLRAVDVDGDGIPDLVELTPTGLVVLRNVIPRHSAHRVLPPQGAGLTGVVRRP